MRRPSFIGWPQFASIAGETSMAKLPLSKCLHATYLCRLIKVFFESNKKRLAMESNNSSLKGTPSHA